MSVTVKREDFAAALKLAATVAKASKGPREKALGHVELECALGAMTVQATSLAETVSSVIGADNAATAKLPWTAHVEAQRLSALVAADQAEEITLALNYPHLYVNGSVAAVLPVLDPGLYPTLPELDLSHQERSFNRDALVGALQRAQRFVGDGKAYGHPSCVFFVLEGAELACYGGASQGLYRETVEVVTEGDFEFRLERSALALLDRLPDKTVRIRPGARFVWVEGERHRLAFLNAEATMMTSTVQGVFEKSVEAASGKVEVDSALAYQLKCGLASLLALSEERSILTLSRGRLSIEGATCKGEVELPGWPAEGPTFKTSETGYLKEALGALDGLDLEVSWKGHQMLILSGGYRTVILMGQLV